MAAHPCNVLRTTIAGTHQSHCENRYPQCRPRPRNAEHDNCKPRAAMRRRDRIRHRADLLDACFGFATIDSDEIDANGDRLFFDEECFLRGVPGAGRFHLDTLAPVAGRGVIVGSKANGAELADPVVDADALAARIRFV